MFDPTYIDSYSNIDAPYQRLDARVKIIVTVAFVVIMAVSVNDRPLRVIPFSLLVIFLAAISR